MNEELSRQVHDLAELACRGRLRLATAESCTGGMVAASFTALAGSSEWFDRGYVTYSNEAKSEELGVPAKLIEREGAVSEAVARGMALGARARSGADWALALTGIAGPGGGSADKPVGTVWISWADPQGRVEAERFQFPGDRQAVREQAARAAILGLAKRLARPAQ